MFLCWMLNYLSGMCLGVYETMGGLILFFKFEANFLTFKYSTLFSLISSLLWFAKLLHWLGTVCSFRWTAGLLQAAAPYVNYCRFIILVLCSNGCQQIRKTLPSKYIPYWPPSPTLHCHHSNPSHYHLLHGILQPSPDLSLLIHSCPTSAYAASFFFKTLIRCLSPIQDSPIASQWLSHLK